MTELTFTQKLTFGYVQPWRSRKYLDWVKSLPCCVCGRPADDPHHINRAGKGMGTKQADCFVIPLCREHHDEIERVGSKSWEGRYGEQRDHALMTIAQAVHDGVLDVQL